jgi:hypothetical protein
MPSTDTNRLPDKSGLDADGPPFLYTGSMPNQAGQRTGSWVKYRLNSGKELVIEGYVQTFL